VTDLARQWLPIALVVASAFAGGLAVGSRAPASSTEAGFAVAQTTSNASPHRRPTVPADHQPDLDRSRDGAIRAAAQLTVAFDGVGLFDHRHRDQLLDTHAASSARARLDETLGEIARVILDELDLTAEMLHEPGFVWRSVPAGARVETFTPDRAVISVWGTGIVVAPGVSLVQPGWRTTHVELVWERDAWRLVAFRSEPGPQPPVVGGTPDAALTARLINEFEPLPFTATDAIGAAS